MMELNLLEAILFVQGEPVSLEDLATWLSLSVGGAEAQVRQLAEELTERGSGLTVQWTGQGVRLATHPALSSELDQRLRRKNPEPLSHASWEVLAIVAYRQPVTRLEIEAIRQTGSERALDTLVDRGLIEEVGRKEAPGRPILYATTREFLTQFGLTGIDALPPLTKGSDSPA